MNDKHDEIYVVGKSIDEHDEFEDVNCMWSHKPAWNTCTKYIHSDLYNAALKAVKEQNDMVIALKLQVANRY